VLSGEVLAMGTPTFLTDTGTMLPFGRGQVVRIANSFGRVGNVFTRMGHGVILLDFKRNAVSLTNLTKKVKMYATTVVLHSPFIFPNGLGIHVQFIFNVFVPCIKLVVFNFLCFSHHFPYRPIDLFRNPVILSKSFPILPKTVLFDKMGNHF
jgi:hypothetical protein